MVAQSHAWLEMIKRVVARDSSWRKTSPFWVWHIHRGARHEITSSAGFSKLTLDFSHHARQVGRASQGVTLDTSGHKDQEATRELP